MEIQSLIPWRKREDDPFTSLQRAVNAMFEDFTRRGDFLPVFGNGEGIYVPKLDVSETDKEVQIAAELPGMDEKDVEVSISGDTLVLKGEKKHEKEEKKKDYYRMERSYGAFHRSIPLPEGVDKDKVDAKFAKGVLTITLPKTVEAQKAAKKVQVKAA
ncbi:MAG: Hsp20/alpha crystallin family protein [Bdellovibrionota bacterium]